MTQSGKPFFWLADTAWELFHRLNDEEAKNYLANSAEKGFTVIQAVALAEDNGLNAPKPSGDHPLIGLDPSQPPEAYFSRVDRLIQAAEKVGLYVALLPTWGEKVANGMWGAGQVSE